METGIFRSGIDLVWRSVRIAPLGHVLSWCGAVLYALASVGLTVVLGRVIDSVVEPGFDLGVSRSNVLLGAAALVGVGVARTVGAMGRRWFLSWAEYSTQRRWRTELTDQYIDVPMSFHHERSAGQLLAHSDADLESATTMLKPLAFAIGTVALAVFALITLALVHPYLALVAVVLFPTLSVMNRSYTTRVALMTAEERELTGRVSAIAHESFDGALTVKTLGREADEVRRFGTAAQLLRDIRIRIGGLRAMFEPVIDALPNLGVVALLVVGAWLVGGDRITVGELASAMALFTILALPIRIVGFFLQQMPLSVAALSRVDDVLAEPAEHDGSVGALPDGPLGLDFDAVAFSYPPVVGEEPDLVLRDLSFAVEPGSTVAIVGSTGSGKSTIAALLGGLIAPTEGEIHLGGVRLHELRAEVRAKALSLVFQEAFLFAASIRENVVLGRDVDASEFEAALVVAGADEFVEKAVDGADTIVGERGVTLSGGQRQRIALARALVGQPRVLVLDDATSAVDPAIEAQILDRLGELHATVVVVAYRLATIGLADRVVYLVDGEVAATGTHEALMSNPGYAALIRAYEAADAA